MLAEHDEAGTRSHQSNENPTSTSSRPTIALDDYAVTGPLRDVYYVPDYLSCAEESALLDAVRASHSWVALRNRRLQNVGGMVTASGLVPAPLPAWARRVVERLSRELPGLYGSGDANHVLVNEYMPGQGILPHEDGPLYFPSVAIVSLGSPAVLRFYPKPNGDDTLAGFDPRPAADEAEGVGGSDGERVGAGGVGGSGVDSGGGRVAAGGSSGNSSGDRAAADGAAGMSTMAMGGAERHSAGPGPGREMHCAVSVSRSEDDGGRRSGCVTHSTLPQRVHGTSPVLSVVLQPRSLLVFRGAAYREALHGIDETHVEVLDETVANAGVAVGASGGVGVGEGLANAGVAVGASGGANAVREGVVVREGVTSAGVVVGEGVTVCGSGGLVTGEGSANAGEGSPTSTKQGSTMINANAGPGLGLARTGARVSLTVRRVERVVRAIRLGGKRG